MKYFPSRFIRKLNIYKRSYILFCSCSLVLFSRESVRNKQSLNRIHNVICLGCFISSLSSSHIPWPGVYSLRKTGLTQYRILFLQMSIYVIVCIKCAAMRLVRPLSECSVVYWRNFSNIFLERIIFRCFSLQITPLRYGTMLRLYFPFQKLDQLHPIEEY